MAFAVVATALHNKMANPARSVALICHHNTNRDLSEKHIMKAIASTTSAQNHSLFNFSG